MTPSRTRLLALALVFGALSTCAKTAAPVCSGGYVELTLALRSLEVTVGSGESGPPFDIEPLLRQETTLYHDDDWVWFHPTDEIDFVLSEAE